MAKTTKAYLDFLFDCYTQGMLLPQDQVDLLIQNDYIKSEIKAPTVVDNTEEPEQMPLPLKKTAEEIKVDNYLIIVIDQETKVKDLHIFDPKNHVDSKYLEVKNITWKDWMPKDVVYHENDFVEWIDSFVFGGFRNMKVFSKFELYKKQAYDWLLENDSISNYVYPEDIEEFKHRELDRCSENKLYACNKYGKIKDAAIAGGWRTYVATKAHEVLIYLDNCGYSMLIGKPRQIAATSTIGLLSCLDIIFKKNYFIKFITESDKKVQEIYEDKIKASYTAFPEWMVPDMLNWTGHHLRLGKKGTRKGRDEGVGSSILTEAPNETAIAGGSPNKALVDEAGNINIFSKMKQDAEPTMSALDPVTNKIRMVRQFIGWGTGGDMEKGGKSFEFEYMSAVKLWKERIWGSGIVPIFFDWSTRPGITQEFYDEKKMEAFSATGPDAAAKRIKFYQQFPSTIEDMFLSSKPTLVDMDFIHANEKRIDSEPIKCKYGYFNAIWDESKPMPEGFDIPYAIRDAEFVETDASDPRMTTIMFQPPKRGYINRYYQGTDPINAESGLSNMASAIWDAEYNTVSAVVDAREQNYKSTYLQCMLLGIYYDCETSMGVKDLIEANIGTNYMSYKEDRGRHRTLVFTSELPAQFRNKSGTQLTGIDNKTSRNKLIIDKLFELLSAYGNRLYIRRIFEQLKTFTCKETDGGNITWGPIDRKYYKDDVLWAITYAYINRQTYAHLMPTSTLAESYNTKYYYPLVRKADGKLTRQATPIRHGKR